MHARARARDIITLPLPPADYPAAGTPGLGWGDHLGGAGPWTVLLLERDELRLLAGLLLHGQKAGGGQQIAAGAGAEAQQGCGGDGSLTLLPQPLSGWWVAGQMLSFNLSLFSLYSLAPWLLQKRGAVFLNLSLLSADF